MTQLIWWILALSLQGIIIYVSFQHGKISGRAEGYIEASNKATERWVKHWHGGK